MLTERQDNIAIALDAGLRYQAEPPGEVCVGRQIVRAHGGGAGVAPGAPPDPYTDQILKLIPVESVSLFVCLDGVINLAMAGDKPQLSHVAGGVWLLVVVAAALIGTPFYLARGGRAVTSTPQLIVSMLAFLVWAFATARSPATACECWPPPIIGNIVLPIFTFLAPLALR